MTSHYLTHSSDSPSTSGGRSGGGRLVLAAKDHVLNAVDDVGPLCSCPLDRALALRLFSAAAKFNCSKFKINTDS